MAPHSRRLRPLPGLVVAGLLAAALPGPAAAGPLVRRAQERRACQEFAGKLQQVSGDPVRAQQVYQQGVLQLVQRFGDNPCGDIPAPTASAAPSTPPASDGGAPARPATPPASAPAPAAPAAAAGATAGKGGATAAPSPEQQQACQQFAGKLQAATASGGATAARQTYAMGLQKLTGMFGANPCPNVQPPQ